MKHLRFLILFGMLFCAFPAHADIDTFVGQESIDTFVGVESIGTVVGVAVAGGEECDGGTNGDVGQLNDSLTVGIDAQNTLVYIPLPETTHGTISTIHAVVRYVAVGSYCNAGIWEVQADTTATLLGDATRVQGNNDGAQQMDFTLDSPVCIEDGHTYILGITESTDVNWTVHSGPYNDPEIPTRIVAMTEGNTLADFDTNDSIVFWEDISCSANNFAVDAAGETVGDVATGRRRSF